MSALPADDTQFDVAIVGGGPAGLTAATYLARFHRKVLLIDAGESRARMIPCTHNYPGFPEGIAGSALLMRMREQAARHGVSAVHARVERIVQGPAGFTLYWRNPEAELPPLHDAPARCVLLATGVEDVPPACGSVEEAVWQGAIRYCPICDGYEVSGKSVALIADERSDLGEALFLTSFTTQLTLIDVHGTAGFSTQDRERLAAAGVRVRERPHSITLGADGRLCVCDAQGEEVFDSVYSALGTRMRCELAIALGAQTTDDGYLVTDRHQRTTVPGLYAAGDVSAGINQISVATGEAAIAATAIHADLKKR